MCLSCSMGALRGHINVPVVCKELKTNYNYCVLAIVVTKYTKQVCFYRLVSLHTLDFFSPNEKDHAASTIVYTIVAGCYNGYITCKQLLHKSNSHIYIMQ